jgi:uncharacterized membrane protein YagU involved in acid resistance
MGIPSSVFATVFPFAAVSIMVSCSKVLDLCRFRMPQKYAFKCVSKTPVFEEFKEIFVHLSWMISLPNK